jgi:hypothetical protein
MESITTRRPSIFGGVTAVAGVGALVAGLALFDERVRVQIGHVVSGNPPTGQMVSMGERVQDFMAIAMQALRDQSIEHAPLVVFAVAAAVLVVFMTRT